VTAAWRYKEQNQNSRKKPQKEGEAKSPVSKSYGMDWHSDQSHLNFPRLVFFAPFAAIPFLDPLALDTFSGFYFAWIA
jgi:hypothetical protein